MVVQRTEVLAYYIVSEMSKEVDRGKLKDFVRRLSEAELTYLVRVLSRFRRNALEEYLVNQQRHWELREIGSDEISVTKVNERVKRPL